MPLLLSDQALEARRAIVTGPLAPLTARLARETALVAARGAWLPTWPPHFTRGWARCAHCGGPLRFDPWSPHRHACARAPHVTVGGDADGWWAAGALLWAADRAVHAAVLAALTDDACAHDVACTLLEALALHVPAAAPHDPVLGPAGVFFSTYLDSLWILALAVACDLLAADARRRSPRLGAAARAQQVTGLVVEQLLLPLLERRAGFDEGRSNRQLWNDAAALAVARLTGDATAAARLLDPRHGALARAGAGLLADGSWYEGENYHQFAVRGLWYLVRLHAAIDAPVPSALRARLDLAWRVPLAAAWPDDTLFARRDAQYGVSLHQWRWAEWFELARADAPHPAHEAALARLYASATLPHDDDARLTSMGESEVNRPPARLARTSLGWKSLLFALAEAPVAGRPPTASAERVHLRSQGLAIERRTGPRGPRLVALDYGVTGGGHGHADRLQLLLADGPRRLLDDWGTGTYADPDLEWYRSALAHAAPIVDGGGEPPVPGHWLGDEARGAANWMAATRRAASGVELRRDVVTTDGYVLDRIAWSGGEEPTRIDLPVPLAGARLTASDGRDLPLVPFDLAARWEAASRGGRIDAGARFVADAWEAPRDGAGWARVVGDEGPVAWLGATRPGAWWRVRTPGPPAWSAAAKPTGPQERHGIAAIAADGVIATVWDLDGVVRTVAWEGDAVQVTLVDGTRHVHHARALGWHIALAVPKASGVATSSIDLAVVDEEAAPAGDDEAPAPAAAPATVWLPRDTVPADADRPAAGAVCWSLGEGAYWRGDDAWAAAGAPHAELAAWHDAGSLELHVAVDKAPLVAASPDAPGVLDGWAGDVHGDGLLLRLVDDAGRAAEWAVIPAGAPGAAHTRRIEGTAAAITARWGWRRQGWWLRVTVPEASRWRSLALVLGLRRAGRKRREAALVCPPCTGWVYGLADRVGSSLPAMPIRCRDA